MFRLDWLTPPEWVSAVAQDPLALLSDHAHCEMKAASSVQSLIVRNPDRVELVRTLVDMAGEELTHFSEVCEVLFARGGALQPTDAGPYAEGLISASTSSRRDRLLDRLLIAQLIEARSLERFHLLAELLADRSLAELYRGLMASEAGHQALFHRLALLYFPEAQVNEREAELRQIEAQIISALPCEPRMHSGPPGA